MKTYSTYQEAKIANPDSKIYFCDKFIAEKDISPSHHTYDYRGLVKCNPADYCMTVEQFLKDGHKFVEGDIWLSHMGSVQTVGVQDSAKDVNRKHDLDNKRYILRAAALGKTHPDIHKDSDFYKKPRTKVEFVKVEDSIFDLKDDFEAGELFSLNSYDNYMPIDTLSELVNSVNSDNLYRRIETPMTEKEALAEVLKEIWIIDGGDGEMQIERIVNSGKFKLAN